MGGGGGGIFGFGGRGRLTIFGGLGGLANLAWLIFSGAAGFFGCINWGGGGGGGGGTLSFSWENAAIEKNSMVPARQIFNRFIIKIFHRMQNVINSIKKSRTCGTSLLVSVNYFYL